MQNATLITISERTGYSISTVSRVLSGQADKYRISSKAADSIKAEAERCSYRPSLLAKGLRTNKTNTIGLMIPSIENPYFANIAGNIISEAKRYNYTIVLIDTMENEQNEKDSLNSLLSRQVDGIIAVPCGQDPEMFENVNRHGVPVVLIDRYYAQTELSYVCTDNYQGALTATNYLIQNGHRHIACIQGTPYSMPVKERIRGYKDALAEAGLSGQEYISGSDFSIQNGYLETRLALNRKHNLSAIFTLSNTILLGAIKAIRESGLIVGQDISLISFDDNKFLDFLDPPVTRISQPIKEIGILAVKILIERIENDKQECTKLQLPPQLIVCNSVKTLLGTK